VTTRFRITAEGMLEKAESDAVTDLDLILSPLSVPAFLANPARWNEFVRENGDAELGGALKELARTLPWFVEAALAKALGPVVGQRAADAGRRLLAFPEYATQRVGEGVASYARDESGLLARSAQMHQFGEGVGEVAARVDTLEQRCVDRAGSHRQAEAAAALNSPVAPVPRQPDARGNRRKHHPRLP